VDFINFTFFDLLDILLAAFLLYQLYRIVYGTPAIRIFIGITAVYLVWKLVDAFHMEVLTEILGQFIGIGFLLLVIVFQQEIRRFLLMIGSATFSRRRRFFKQLLMLRKTKNESDSDLIDPIVLACQNMSSTSTGALIVLTQNTPLSNYSRTGTFIDARITSTLLESIFSKNSPMHDGAVIISNDRIEGAGAILPVSDNTNLPARFGLRHRAALGICEKSDAICIVVSEETGQIVVAHGSKLKPTDIGELKSKLIRLTEHG
jgi:uncharacterized protein (TIGR00159 family)